MLAEAGNYALFFGCICFLFACCELIITNDQKYHKLVSVVRSFQLSGILCIFFSYAALTSSFLLDDFSVKFIYDNSSTNLPWYYKITAVWGGHEGSVLLWILIHSIMMLLLRHRSVMLAPLRDKTLQFMTVLAFLYTLFALLTSNPFLRLIPFSPSIGTDLNPLLQDFAMIIHPPLLYFGFISLGVVYATALAVIRSSYINTKALKVLRIWTLISCIFLTFGITLGSWWAYYELGWGGFWFWDPVENSSLVPWLITIALLHCIIGVQRGVLSLNWVYSLSLTAFCLSLLAVFLVRSGIVISVHSFASDSTRGIWILLGFVVVFCFGTIYYLLKKTNISFTENKRGSDLSFELFLIVQNLLLCTSAVLVLTGTLYPLFYEAFTDRKLTISADWFNSVMLPVVMLMLSGLCLVNYRKQLFDFVRSRFNKVTNSKTPAKVWKFLQLNVGLAIVICLVILLAYDAGYTSLQWLGIVFCMFTAIWLLLSNLFMITRPSMRSKAAVISHSGFAIGMLAICILSFAKYETTQRLQLGDSLQLANKEYLYLDKQQTQTANYLEVAYRIDVLDVADASLIRTHYPAHRYYASNSTTEASISSRLWGDEFVTVGQRENDSLVLTVRVLPFVKYIWGGCLLIGIGLIVSLRSQLLRKGDNTIPMQSSSKI